MKKETIIKSNISTAILMETIVRDAYGPKPSGEMQPLQWSILRYLMLHPTDQCTMSLIRRSLKKTHAPVVRAIKTLESRGYLEQVLNPQDARSKLLLLTETGRDALDADPILKIVRRFDVLPKRDLKILKNAIRLMALSTDTDHKITP